jgi:hypothetical protein
METKETNVDAQTSTNNKTEWDKMSCPEVASKIKEIKNVLMTSKMPKQDRMSIEKDLELGERYYKINCNIKVEVDKGIDIIKSAEKPNNDVTKKQIKSIGKPPMVYESDEKIKDAPPKTTKQSSSPSISPSILPTKDKIKDEIEKEISTFPTWKLFLVLGLIGGGIYFIKRKWK